jgi:hypothetical protein
VACMRPPERVVADAQEMLNEVIPPGRDRRDYCMVLTNLEALGQKMGTFLNQPKQKQIILEDDLHMRLANFGLQEARRAARASPTPALNLCFFVRRVRAFFSPPARQRSTSTRGRRITRWTSPSSGGASWRSSIR